MVNFQPANPNLRSIRPEFECLRGERFRFGASLFQTCVVAT